MSVVLHLAERRRWERALETGRYVPRGFDDEGFVHCSESHQLRAVADRLFRGREDLIVLVIETDHLTSAVRHENLEGGDELYPHVYGPIEVGAVIGVHEAEPGRDGRLELPESDHESER